MAGDKITSIAGLKKVLKIYTQLYFPKGAEDYGKGLKDGSRIALEKIGEFEASVREPILETITLLQDLLGAVECEPSGHERLEKDVEKTIGKLRRILGEGDR